MQPKVTWLRHVLLHTFTPRLHIHLRRSNASPETMAILQRHTFLIAATSRTALLRRRSTSSSPLLLSTVFKFLRPFSTTGKVSNKPSICTADELHYVSLPGSHWKLALWRYTPSAQAPSRNHPLLLLSGVGTNAIGYDLSPESSFARHMSRKGFDTWILEVRGTGLSIHEEDSERIEQSASERSREMEDVSESKKGDFGESKVSAFQRMLQVVGMKCDESKLLRGLSKIYMVLSNWLSTKILHHHAFDTMNEFQKQLEFIAKYEWDFDHYLEEDLPVAMDYVRAQTLPRDGKVLAIGHSMGGILLYAMLSKYVSEGKDPRLTAVVTLASSLDYSNSASTLKLLLPFADPAQTLNLSVIPLGALLSATYPISSRTPYVTSWLYNFISAENMMHPELLKKLILNSFCAIPTKLLLQLTTAFRGGISNRDGTFSYKDHLHKSNVPVLALAGNSDRICPPEAVLETVKLFPKDLITYKVFGEAEGPRYAHYDLVGGRQAPDQVYPCIVDFITRHDQKEHS
ncbi:unnamed protein product [Rhodiola kirilowii]